MLDDTNLPSASAEEIRMTIRTWLDYGEVSKGDYDAFMSEIQLRAIVQNMDKQDADQQTDGDEVIMVKDGKTISKFSREALEIGATLGSTLWARFLISTR